MSSLTIQLTTGARDPERAAQAVTVAAAAVVSGVEVSLWLSGDAVSFATVDGGGVVFPPAYSPWAELGPLLFDAAQVSVCVQSLSTHGVDTADLAPGVRVAGAASLVSEIIAPDTRVLVY